MWQEVYNVAQEACSTLFLNTPMASLCKFIRQAAIMARQDRDMHCLPHGRQLDNNEHSSMFHVCVAWWCLGEGTMYGPKKMI